MEPVLFGLEMEYGLTPVGPDGTVLDRGWAAGALLDRIRQRHAHLPDATRQGLFLANGGRIYVDQGPHPEASTPECTHPAEAVRRVRECEALLAEAARDVEREAPPGTRILLTACNMDYGGGGETWGCHESYLCRRTARARVARGVLPHLVSRIVYTGSGGFHNRRRNALEFLISPRACQVREVEGGSRSFLNKLDEPLSRDHARLHLTIGESLQSALGTWLKLGTTALVVRLLDLGLLDARRLALRDPKRAILAVARDPRCRRQVTLADGRRLSALRIQQHYLDAVARHLGHPDLPDWAEAVCERWEAMLQRLGGAPETVADRLDWGIKHALFERWRRRGPGREGPAAWARLRELDLRYGELGAGGLFPRLRAAGAVEEEAELASVDPRTVPATRAPLRGALVRELSGRPGRHSCDWESVVDGGSQRFADLRDPFETELRWQPVADGGLEWERGGLLRDLLRLDRQGFVSPPAPLPDLGCEATGLTLRASVDAFSHKVSRIAWSPDGASLACPSRDGRVHLYDLERGALRAVLEGHAREAVSASWSADGERLASGGYDDVARIWDVASGRQQQVLQGHRREVMVAWSPDGRTLATCSQEGQVILWQGSPRLQARLRISVPDCAHVAWSPDSRRLAVACLGGRVCIWDVRRGELALEPDGHEGDALMVGFSPDGRWLGSTGKDGTARIWNASTGRALARLDRHGGADVLVLAFSPDARLLATKGRDDAVRLSSTRSWQELAVIPERSSPIGWGVAVAFHPVLPLLATLGRGDREVRIWDVDLALADGAL